MTTPTEDQLNLSYYLAKKKLTILLDYIEKRYSPERLKIAKTCCHITPGLLSSPRSTLQLKLKTKQLNDRVSVLLKYIEDTYGQLSHFIASEYLNEDKIIEKRKKQHEKSVLEATIFILRDKRQRLLKKTRLLYVKEQQLRNRL